MAVPPRKYSHDTTGTDCDDHHRNRTLENTGNLLLPTARTRGIRGPTPNPMMIPALGNHAAQRQTIPIVEMGCSTHYIRSCSNPVLPPRSTFHTGYATLDSRSLS